MRRIPLLIALLMAFSSIAQFAPAVGQMGSTAIYKDSTIIMGWATTCSVVRGPVDIRYPLLSLASSGHDSLAIGKAGNGVVSLGDGGIATLTFSPPITNGEGPDFSVFENSFSDNFLELAFVEVSSDGLHFVRFPATSLLQDTSQTGPFGLTEATQIHNLAGKYRGLYGTPFDLEELKNIEELNLSAITHIRLIDVIGSIDNTYASTDQYGQVINDPWPTAFPSGGFDLDAVGVIHQSTTAIAYRVNQQEKAFLYPNPVTRESHFYYTIDSPTSVRISIKNNMGQELRVWHQTFQEVGSFTLPLKDLELATGLYYIQLHTSKTSYPIPFLITHD